MRILFVNTPSYCGGSEISLITLIDYLARRGIETELLTTESGQLTEALAALNITTRTQQFPWLSRRYPWPYLSSIAKLARYVRASHFDLIHTNCEHCLPYVMHVSRLTNVPYVSHIRDMVRNWFEPNDRLQGLLRANAVIVSSEVMRDYCVEHTLAPRKVTVINDPIELSAFTKCNKANGTAMRESWGVPSCAIVVGIIGHIQRIKGHQEFIDAASLIAERHRNVHFVIVGSAANEDGNSFASQLYNQVFNSRFRTQIHFVGYQTDMPSVYSAIDIVAAPSWTEAFGRAAIEAMAAGCAVVASDQDGHKESVQNDVTGLLVPPHSVTHLADAISRLVENPDLRSDLADKGKASSARYAAEQRTEDIAILYEKVLHRA
jgi:glycosyltransferase involved in cell wall biosynthesis